MARLNKKNAGTDLPVFTFDPEKDTLDPAFSNASATNDAANAPATNDDAGAPAISTRTVSKSADSKSATHISSKNVQQAQVIPATRNKTGLEILAERNPNAVQGIYGAANAAGGASADAISAAGTEPEEAALQKGKRGKRGRRKSGRLAAKSRDVRARAITIEQTDAHIAEDKRHLRRKVLMSVAALCVVVLAGLCIYGSDGGWGIHYKVYSPLDVFAVIGEHIYNAAASVGFVEPHDTSNYAQDWPLYFALPSRFGVIFITIVCAVLLAVSGMLYQNVFKNPIAGPGMLGVSSGVTLGNTLLVYFCGGAALGLAGERYALCYGLGAAVLAFVILAGRKLSGKGKPFDIITMLLIGSIFSQLVGFISTYLTMFVMDPDMLAIYTTLSQMLVVDTSLVSYICLGIACVISLVPVWLLRFRFNVLSFDEQEVRLLGVNMMAIRAVALICGAIMILAAQIHIGAVAMVSLVVPFMARHWFGCEARKQLIGSVCIATVLLVACRCIVDLIPFVGDGIGIGSAVSVVAMPLFLLIMARHMKGWE